MATSTPDRAQGGRTDDDVEILSTAEERTRAALEDRRSSRVAGFRHWFGRAATRVSEAVGSAWAFLAALVVLAMWAITGPIFGFSDTWQLIINTGTTIVTFLMVFLIQNTQNRDSKATQLKLDELIRAVSDARNRIIGAEEEDEEQLKREKQAMEAHKNDHQRRAADERGEDRR